MPDAERRAPLTLEEFEQLTVQACRAAEQGDWDTVERCVDRRGELFAQTAVPALPADRLVEMDIRIQTLAMTARTAVATILVEVGRTRRNLQQLQQGNAGREPERNRFMNVRA